jgi:hypothetical protein
VSISIALAMGAFGLVMTDGRRVESDGRSVRDDYDKTFAIGNPHLIAASVGLLEFAGLTVADHVRQLAEVDMAEWPTLHDACCKIGERLAARLGSINEAEVGFQHRKLELLFVGRGRLTSGNPRICSVGLHPDPANQRIERMVQLWNPDDYYVTAGDDLACRRIRLRMPKPARRFLLADISHARRRLTDVMTEAIAHCGSHPLYRHIPACGGVPHVQVLEVAES